MNYKYLGEAVVLLGIAYSVIKWIARNAPDADRRPRGPVKIELGRFGLPREVEAPKPTPPTVDPRALDAAAAAFGIAPEAVKEMDARERALLVSAYASAHTPSAAKRPSEGG